MFFSTRSGLQGLRVSAVNPSAVRVIKLFASRPGRRFFEVFSPMLHDIDVLNQPPTLAAEPASADARSPRLRRGSKKDSPSPRPARFPAHIENSDAPSRQAELFYLQKQIQSQTPMVIILEDGERIEGCIEWYDHNSLKVRGRAKTLIFKSAIKYMYKLGENGHT